MQRQAWRQTWDEGRVGASKNGDACFRGRSDQARVEIDNGLQFGDAFGRSILDIVVHSEPQHHFDWVESFKSWEGGDETANWLVVLDAPKGRSKSVHEVRVRTMGPKISAYSFEHGGGMVSCVSLGEIFFLQA